MENQTEKYLVCILGPQQKWRKRGKFSAKNKLFVFLIKETRIKVMMFELQ